MLTLDTFATLAVGDLIDGRPLFAGLSSEPLRLQVSQIFPTRTTFVVEYFGIRIGTWTCRRQEDALIWEIG